MEYHSKVDLHRIKEYSEGYGESAPTEKLRPIVTLNKVQMRESNDVYEHACNITGWQQLYNQLAPGDFKGSVMEGWLEGIQFFKEYTNKVVQQKCMVWPGALWIGIPLPENSQNGMIADRELFKDFVGIQMGGREFSLNTPDHYTILGLVVDIKLLDHYFETVLHRPFPIEKVENMLTIQMNPYDKQRLCNMLESALILSQNIPGLLNNVETVKSLHYDLLGLLSTLFKDIDHTVHINSLERAKQNHIGIVRRAHEFILDNVQGRDELNIVDLCEFLKVSRRTLQNAFNSVWNVSPIAYLKAIKLNAVHRELKSPYSRFLTVQDAAMAWGFWHMGQFSKDYQALFHELPSHTLSQRLVFN